MGDARSLHRRSPHARAGALAGLAVAACLALAACGSSEQKGMPTTGGTATPSETSSATSTPQAPTSGVVVTIEGDQVSPSGERVEATVGDPIHFSITSDRDGELHVHSNPEQEIAFTAGTTTEYDLTVDQPGLVEVEDHETDSVVVQLEVR